MSQRKRRLYSDESKRNALELAKTSDKSDAQMERDLWMSAGLLSRWRDRYRLSEGANELELGEIQQLRAELKQLQRENWILTQERDILKKAVTIFSKDQ